MISESDEEIFSRYATNQPRQTRLKSAPRKRRSKLRKIINVSKKEASRLDITPARVYLFNFFLFSSFGSLMPFMPIFFKLLGFSSLENGILFSVRPLISFWWGPIVASFATGSRFRQLILFICVAGTIASTFCISVVRTNDGGILQDQQCNPKKIAHLPHTTIRTSLNVSTITFVHPTEIFQRSYPENNSTLVAWKKYIKDKSQKIYHELRKGIVMTNMFISVLVLTIVSEMFMSPTLHVAQASIRFRSEQPLFNSLCLNRIFCKIGMTVAALCISYVAWKYRCIFKNVHYFYFHFYGFLATGCITALFSLILPRENPQNTSFFSMICGSFLSIVFDWNNFGYIFGLWIAGIAEGTINAYILWYAHDNGASELVIGILVSIALFTDMVLHFTVGVSMRWVGHTGLLSTGIFLLSVQFFILSLVNHPLFLIPTQLLCGLASCCIRSSFIGCARSNGSKEMEKILFFVFQAAYMGFGLGLGGVFISMPYFVFGAQKTFSAIGILTMSFVSLYILVQICVCIRNPRKRESVRYKKLSSGDRNSDWLIDALEEEEKKERKTEKENEAEEEIFFMEEGEAKSLAIENENNNQNEDIASNNQDEEIASDVQTVT